MSFLLDYYNIYELLVMNQNNKIEPSFGTVINLIKEKSIALIKSSNFPKVFWCVVILVFSGQYGKAKYSKDLELKIYKILYSLTGI